MSVAEILEQVRRLPPEEQLEVAERIRTELRGLDDELTPEEIAELDRRAEDALNHPGRGKPAEQVFAEIQERLLAKK